MVDADYRGTEGSVDGDSGAMACQYGYGPLPVHFVGKAGTALLMISIVGLIFADLGTSTFFHLLYIAALAAGIWGIAMYCSPDISMPSRASDATQGTGGEVWRLRPRPRSHSPYPRRMSRYDAAPCSPTQSEARNHIMRFPRMTPPPSAPDVAVKPTTIRFSSSMILSIVRWIRCSPTHDWSMSIVRPSPSGLIASSYSSSASALALPAAYSCNSCNPIRVSRYGRLWPRNWRIATRR